MKVWVLLLALLFLTSAKVPPGVVEQIYSRKGLEDHYVSLFKHSESTFGDHDMGTEGDVWGWWIFGTGMTIKNTYLDEYKLGEVSKINFADMTYDFEHSEVSGILKYTWTYRWFVIPFNHKAECKFKVGVHHLKQKFELDGEKLEITRDIDYTSGAPTLDCNDGDQFQDSSSSFDWMVQVRNKYVEKLGQKYLQAMNDWLDDVDSIYTSSTSAELDDLTYTLTPHLKEAEPDATANLVLGYNYDLALNKKTRSPTAGEDMASFSNDGDLTTYYFQEYFQSMLELDKEAVDFWLALTDSNLPKGLDFGLKIKDFLYIIEGADGYDQNADVDVGCEYGEGDAMINITSSGVLLNLPIMCTLRTGPSKLMTATFEYNVKGSPTIAKDGTLSLTSLSYNVQNFVSKNNIATRILDEYLIRRIQEYSNVVNPMLNVTYNDGKFSDMDRLSVTAGEMYLRVVGDIPD